MCICKARRHIAYACVEDPGIEHAHGGPVLRCGEEWMRLGQRPGGVAPALVFLDDSCILAVLCRKALMHLATIVHNLKSSNLEV